MNWKGARDYIMGRLAERSTWGGLITLSTTVGGFIVKPEHIEQIAMAGAAVGSLLLILLKENGSQR
jgi:hypothetical protein